MSVFLQNLQLALAVCRIVICSVCCCNKKKSQPMAKHEVVCIGLSGSGKTTLLSVLSKQNTDDITPTTGFMIKACQMENCILNIKEVGGADSMIQYWKHYYNGCSAVIFVVDSASETVEFERATRLLHEALGHPDLEGTPCLVVANCQDKADARNEQQIRDEMYLESACSGRQWTLSLCSMSNAAAVSAGFDKLASILQPPQNAV